jgi:hypothetical protein
MSETLPIDNDAWTPSLARRLDAASDRFETAAEPKAEPPPLASSPSIGLDVVAAAPREQPEPTPVRSESPANPWSAPLLRRIDVRALVAGLREDSAPVAESDSWALPPLEILTAGALASWALAVSTSGGEDDLHGGGGTSGCCRSQ